MAKIEFQKVNLTEGKPKLLDFIINHPGCSQREIASNHQMSNYLYTIKSLTLCKGKILSFETYYHQ